MIQSRHMTWMKRNSDSRHPCIILILFYVRFCRAFYILWSLILYWQNMNSSQLPLFHMKCSSFLVSSLGLLRRFTALHKQPVAWPWMQTQETHKKVIFSNGSKAYNCMCIFLVKWVFVKHRDKMHRDVQAEIENKLFKLITGVIIAVNISERKSGTERTKKRKKTGVSMFSHRQGAQRSKSPISVRFMDFARATITRDVFIPSPTQFGLSHSLTNRQNTLHFTSFKSDLALPSTGSWLPSRLSSTWRWKERIECIFSNSKYAKKAGHFEWKAGKRDGAKKREFTPERGTVDTYAWCARRALFASTCRDRIVDVIIFFIILAKLISFDSLLKCMLNLFFIMIYFISLKRYN